MSRLLFFRLKKRSKYCLLKEQQKFVTKQGQKDQLLTWALIISLCDGENPLRPFEIKQQVLRGKNYKTNLKKEEKNIGFDFI